MKQSIHHAIVARLKLAAIKETKHAVYQLESHLAEKLKVADALKALTDQQVYELCKPPAKKEAS